MSHQSWLHPGCVALAFALASCHVAAQQVAASPSAAAPAPAQRTPFPHYTDKARGWFWKEAIPDSVQEPEDPPLPPPPSQPSPAVPMTPDGPRPLSVAWMKENLPKYMELAIEDPTPQNLSNYLYLQRMAMDASERFAREYQRVALSDPFLDGNTSRPTWNAAGFSLDDSAERGRVKTLKALAATHGIWFFFRSDCEACHMQAPVLASFARLYGFSILAISLDGKNLPGSPFKSFVTDKGQAERLDVQYTPAIFLARPPSGMFPISQAPIALTDLESRVVEIAAANGVINQDQYQATRADRKNLLPSPAKTTITDASATDPNAVREHLRALLKSPSTK